VNTHPEQWAVWGAVGGSVPCSRSPLSWYWVWRERYLFTPSNYNSCRPETRTPIRPRIPQICLLFLKKKEFSIFVYLNPFQQLLYDFEIHLFTPRTTEGLKRSLMLKKNHALRAGVRNFWTEWRCVYFSYLTNTALQKLQKILTCFPEDKISYIYSDLQIKKIIIWTKFSPWLLMHRLSFWSVWTFCNYIFSFHFNA